jgi:hypothetical protein
MDFSWYSEYVIAGWPVVTNITLWWNVYKICEKTNIWKKSEKKNREKIQFKSTH